MKKLIFLFLLINTSAFPQTKTLNQLSGNQLDYFKSNQNELLDENGYTINSSIGLDSVLLNGVATNDFFGFSVSSAGDVNGDGYSDLIVGAPGYNNNTGRAYIFYGGGIMNNTADVTMTGEVINNEFAYVVSPAGDVNGDGYDDVIVSAPGYSNYLGKTYIFYGGVNMNNIADVTMTGEATNDEYGRYAASTAGDINGDGYDDIIVGAHNYSTATGRAYIYFGSAVMDNLPDVILTGDSMNISFGISATYAGDVNGDGYSDVIIGAHQYNNNKGKASIFYGGAIMNSIADVTVFGELINDYFGASVSSAGDVNNDGYSDVIIGAFASNGYTGRAYIYYGGSTMNSIVDVTFSGENGGDLFGIPVSTAGDVDNDGYDDVIIGAKAYSSSKGRAYTFFGNSAMDTVVDIVKTGEVQGDYLGYSLSTAGDVNNDGYSDLIIGAFGSNSKGRAFIYMKKKELVKINLKVLIEGMYYPVFNQMTRSDSVKVYLRNVTSPYAIIDSSKGIIDSISFSNVFVFPNAPNGSYYIVVKHFNCIETWSKDGGEVLISNGSIYNYDFTTSITQSYANNMIKVDNSPVRYAIYSGNVNQDFIIDAADISAIENDATQAVEGYVSTDLNGDYFVDGADLSIVENNVGVFKVTP